MTRLDGANYRRFTLYTKLSPLGRGKQFGVDFSLGVFGAERRFVPFGRLRRGVFCGTIGEKGSGAGGKSRFKEQRGEGWERRRMGAAGRFGASSRRRLSWFTRGRVGFATSESSRLRRSAESARVAFRWRRWFATSAVERRAFRRGRFADVAVGSRFGKRLAGTTRFVGGVCGEPALPTSRSTRRARCIFIAGRRGRSCCS